jgi:hypothetical protein
MARPADKALFPTPAATGSPVHDLCPDDSPFAQPTHRMREGKNRALQHRRQRAPAAGQRAAPQPGARQVVDQHVQHRPKRGGLGRKGHAAEARVLDLGGHM